MEISSEVSSLCVLPLDRNVDLLAGVYGAEFCFSFGLTGTHRVVLKVGVGQCGENADDDHHNHYFHQTETIDPPGGSAGSNAKSVAHKVGYGDSVG